MLRYTTQCHKHPVIFRQGQGMFTHQLKRILNKKSLHRYNWDELPMYNPRKLAHADRVLDHDTYDAAHDPHWDERAHWVPDQRHLRLPIPPEYKDAYWWRDLQARRVQCPVEWVSHRMYNAYDRHAYDFQDLAFRKKFAYNMEEVVQNAKDMRKVDVMQTTPREGAVHDAACASSSSPSSVAVLSSSSNNNDIDTATATAAAVVASSSSSSPPPLQMHHQHYSPPPLPPPPPHSHLHHLHTYHGASMALLAADAAVGISDPELDTEPHAGSRSRHVSPSPPPPHDGDGVSTAASTTTMSSPSSSSAAAAVTVTAARTSVSCEATPTGQLQLQHSARERTAASDCTTALRALCARVRAPPLSSSSSCAASSASMCAYVPARLAAMAVRDVYVHGKTMRQYLLHRQRRQRLQEEGLQRRRGSRGAVGAAVAAANMRSHTQSDGTVAAAFAFQQDMRQSVTAMDAQGEHLAVGDRAGRLLLMQRRAMTRAQRAYYLRHATQAMRSSSSSSSDDDNSGEDDDDEEEGRARDAATTTTAAWPRARAPFVCFASHAAYTPCIDTLNSGEVAPAVTAVALLPSSSSFFSSSSAAWQGGGGDGGAAAYVLCANEKLPRLYKALCVREAAAPFRAVDKIDTRTIGPLTAASRASTTTLKCVSQYAHGHESSIHSLCCLAQGRQFVSADEVALRLWCVDYSDTSLDVYDIRGAPACSAATTTTAAAMDAMAVEYVRGARVFAEQQPCLLFLTTTSGCVRVLDTRQSLRWGKQVAQTFVSTPWTRRRRVSDSSSGSSGGGAAATAAPAAAAVVADKRAQPRRDTFDDDDDDDGDADMNDRIADMADADVEDDGNGLSDCALSPCGRYIAGRDSAGLCLWDVRVAAATTTTTSRGASPAVRSWLLPATTAAMPCVTAAAAAALYSRADVYEEQRCDVQFVSPVHVCTGGSALYTLDIIHEAVTAARQDAPHDEVMAYTLPALDRVTHGEALTAHSLRRATAPSRGGASSAASCVSLLTRPVASPGGVCGMFAACGQAVVQFTYELTRAK